MSRHIAAIRRSLNEGARLVTGFRFARLFHDGDRLWLYQDQDEIWRRLTKAITEEKRSYAKGHWSFDINRLVGLHQVRTWLRRQRAAVKHEKEMAV